VNTRFLPWLRLWWAWSPALLLFLATSTLLIWQLASPRARQAAIEKQCSELQATILHLEKINQMALAEKENAADSSRKLQEIYDELFGNLDQRLTAVLRAIGEASRDAGLFPKGFSYSIENAKKTGSMRFVTGFSVEGNYDQIRQLLKSCQESPQFLMIDKISFRGEEDPRSKNLRIRLAVSTALSDTDPSTLNRIIERLGLKEGLPDADIEDHDTNGNESPKMQEEG